MKTVFFSDVHGVVTAIWGNHNEFLGDPTLAAAYTQNAEVLDSIHWTREALGPSVLNALAGFGAPRKVELGEGVVASCYHATPTSSTEVVTEDTVACLAGGVAACRSSTPRCPGRLGCCRGWTMWSSRPARGR